MHFFVEPRDGYLLAEMTERDTSDETAQFVQGIVEGLLRHQADRLLISIRKSRPIFKVEEWRLSKALDAISHIAGLRIAFIADSRDLGLSQQYISLLVVQKGIASKAFPSEAAALAWLREK